MAWPNLPRTFIGSARKTARGSVSYPGRRRARVSGAVIGLQPACVLPVAHPLTPCLLRVGCDPPRSVLSAIVL
ncbi:MAG: hypothetical protein C4297_11260 [Gemmataceae bacterium]